MRGGFKILDSDRGAAGKPLRTSQKLACDFCSGCHAASPISQTLSAEFCRSVIHGKSACWR